MISDRQRLLDLYSAAAACKCDVSPYELYEPDAPTALIAWASSVGRTARCHAGSVEVEIDKWSIIVRLAAGRPATRDP